MVKVFKGKKAIEKERTRRKAERTTFKTGTKRGRAQLAEREATRAKEPKKPVTKKPIKAGIDISAKKAREPEKTLGQKAVGVITSPKTTIALGLTLATLLTAGGAGAAAAGVGSRAIITRTAIKGATSMTTQRAVVGKSAKFGLDKAFHTVKPVVARFATNPKSAGLTKSLLSKTGLSLGAASLFVGAVGSYPFAGFIKEEALQTLNIGIFKAVDAGDIEGAEKLIAEVDEILNNEGNILDKVPYANVLRQLKTFFNAASETNEEWRRIIEQKKAEVEEPSFEEKRVSSDEAARERELGQRERDAEYFALIREGKFEEAEELLQEELKDIK